MKKQITDEMDEPSVCPCPTVLFICSPRSDHCLFFPLSLALQSSPLLDRQSLAHMRVDMQRRIEQYNHLFISRH